MEEAKKSAARPLKKDLLKYAAAYSAAFFAALLTAYVWYFVSGHTFIWETDGWQQHYRALVYYSEYLRKIIRSVFIEHRLNIPAYDFAFGEGGDILQILNYYVIGDPFDVFSAAVPVRYMYVYYDAMIIFRLYLAGLAFSYLCFKTGCKNRLAVIAGAISYLFSYWAIYNTARHPYFLNPMIYMPLMIVGIEKILKKERPYLFIGTVFVSALSNFYFFYMIVLITVIYAAVRLILFYKKNIKQIAITVGRLALYAVTGVLLSAVLFLPVLYTFLSNGRMNSENAYHFLYPSFYYSKFPSLFMVQGGNYWLCMGYAAPVLLAVFLLFIKKKKSSLLKVLSAICLAIALVPFFGQIFNGFSYMSNRWCWAMALFVSYILAFMWDELVDLDGKSAVLLGVCLAAYTLLCMLLRQTVENTFTMIGICFAVLLFLFPFRGKELFGVKARQWLVFSAIFLCTFLNSRWKNTAAGDDYLSRILTKDYVKEFFYKNETEAVRKIAEKNSSDIYAGSDFYRYSGSELTVNAGLTAGMSSTQFYWSLSNPQLTAYRTELGISESVPFNYKGYDERAALLALASVRYYAVPVRLPSGYRVSGTGSYDASRINYTSGVPYGFSQAGTVQLSEDMIYDVYQNDFALPLAFTYDSFITAKQWEGLSPVEKQQAMLQAAVIESKDADRLKENPENRQEGNEAGAASDGITQVTADNIETETVFPEYEMDFHGDIAAEGNKFTVNKEGASVTISFDGAENSENYLLIEGLYFDTFRNTAKWGATTDIDFTFNISTGASKTMKYCTEDYFYYDNRHDFAVSFGYSKEAAESVTVTFPEAGVYTFSTLRPVCQPMGSFQEKIQRLKSKIPDSISVSEDEINGAITVDKPELLYFSIPFSKGWSAYVDGKPADLYQANKGYMAIAVSEGEHSFRLCYETPMLKQGTVISVFALLVLCGIISCVEKKCRLRYIENEDAKVG